MNDLRYAFRMLLKSPGFTLVAVLTLALGLSANISIFSMVSMFFFQPLPVKDADRLVMVLQKSDVWKLPHGHSWPDYEDYRQRVSEFEDALALFFNPAHLSSPGQPAERAWIEAVSANYFSFLGAQAAHGRLLLPTEGRVPGADAVVVLSHDYWKRQFGGDPSVVGRTVMVNGHPFTVVGVAAAGFYGAQWGLAPSVWLPASMLGQVMAGGGDLLKNRASPVFKVMARLKPGMSVSQARAAVGVVAQQLEKEYPDAHRNATVLLMSEKLCRPEPSFSEFTTYGALIFLLMVGFVLFIACANVANLMFARALARRKEMCIRAAIGASRGQLIRQLLVESVLLALLAGMVGCALAWGTGDLLRGFTPTGDIPMRTDQDWDWRSFAFTFVISLLAGVVTGLVPALRATAGDVNTTLKEGAVTLAGSGRHLFRSVLVISQVALCLVVLVCGGLFLQSLRQMGRLDLGFHPDHLLMASLDLGLARYDDQRGRQFVDRLLERARALPGVQAAAVAQSVPFDYMIQLRDYGAEGKISEGKPGQDGYINGPGNHVSPEYFTTLGSRLLRGRQFSRADDAAAPQVVIINETAARRLWPEADALGKRLRYDRGGEFREVVGIVRDGKYVMLGEEPRPCVFVPFAQGYRSPLTLHVRTAGDPLALVPAIRALLTELDPHLPIYNVRSMEQHLRGSAFGLMPLRMGATLAAIQGVIGLLLAVMGLYGVVAYSVAQRTREIGIRMALGAPAGEVLRLIIRDGWRLTLVGLGVGFAIAVGMALLLSRLLVGVTPWNVPVFAAVLALLAGVSLLACYLPARRATRVDPVIALRSE